MILILARTDKSLSFYFYNQKENMNFFSSNQTLQAIRNAFVVTMPLFLAGALGLLFVNFPLPAYQEVMLAYVGPSWKTAGIWMFNATFGIISLVVSFSVSYNLAEQHNGKHPLRQVNPVIVSLISSVR